MEASTFSTSALSIRPVLFTPEEEVALVGFLAGYSGLTRARTGWISASTLPGAPNATSRCSVRAAPTSSRSVATSKRSVGHEPRSVAGSAPSPPSTVTPKKRA